MWLGKQEISSKYLRINVHDQQWAREKGPLSLKRQKSLFYVWPTYSVKAKAVFKYYT